MEMSVDRVASWATIIVTILALPGYFVLFNEWGRKVMEEHKLIPYSLLVAILLVCLAGVASQFGWFKSKEFERVVGRAFHNQTVEIDGKLFEDCTFENVIFRHRGGRHGFVRATIKGARSFETSDLGATGAINLLKDLGFLESGFAASWKSKSLDDFK